MSELTDGTPSGAPTPEEAMRRYEQAASAHDVDGALRLIHRDALYWFSDETAHAGKTAVGAVIAANFQAIENEHYRILDLVWRHVGPTAAVCTYRFTWSGLVRGRQTGGGGRGTNVLVRGPEGWVILHEHLSRGSAG